MYTTRSEVSTRLPIRRKGTKYILTSKGSKKDSISILFVIRDLLKITRTKKETKQILNRGDIQLNGKVIKEEKLPVQIADLIQIEKLGKNYRLIIKNNKFDVEEIKDKEANHKIVKVVNIKSLPNKKIQINLRDGQNILSNEKINVGDSIVLEIKKKKIEKILKLEKNCNIEIIGGKYSGSIGKLESVESRTRGKVYIIKVGNKRIELSFKLIRVIE